MFLVWTLCIFAMGWHPVHANDDLDDPSNPCSTHALNAYRQCIRDNPCTCQNCHADPNDPTWVIEAVEPNSCQDISRIFCPLVRCCSACESVFSFYHSCLADKIASIYMGEEHNCQLFICANEADDADCTPTEAPTPMVNPCETPLEEYQTCIDQDSTCTGCPASDLSTLHLELTGASPRTCQEVNEQVFCPLDTCCPSCATPLDAVATCVETNLVTQPDDVCPNTKCAVSSPTTPAPTPSPIAPGSVQQAGTPSGATRMMGSLLLSSMLGWVLLVWGM